MPFKWLMVEENVDRESRSLDLFFKPFPQTERELGHVLLMTING